VRPTDCSDVDPQLCEGRLNLNAQLGVVRRISAVLSKDLPKLHFQRRVCDLEDFAFEFAKAIGFRDGIGALQAWVQKPDFGNAFINVIFAALSKLREKVVIDDCNAHEWDLPRRCFQVELLAKKAQMLALFPFFI
jgi:hypothetical protein